MHAGRWPRSARTSCSPWSSRSSPPRQSVDVTVGPGDDAAVLALGAGGLVATTDAVVHGRDWRDEWSTGADVGAKVAAQNVADVAAMGARPVALLVTLVMAPSTEVEWVLDLARGLASVRRSGGLPVVGGDLSSAPEGVLTVSVTALGALDGRRPVLRSGAQAGDVVAVAGSLGLSGAGLHLLQTGRPDADPQAVAVHRRPVPPIGLGPVAADAGATSMIDLSDGLLRDASRVATASGVRVDLALGRARRRRRPPRARGGRRAGPRVRARRRRGALAAGDVPRRLGRAEGFRVIGAVRAGGGVAVDGIPQQPRGWDHFGG